LHTKEEKAGTRTGLSEPRTNVKKVPVFRDITPCTNISEDFTVFFFKAVQEEVFYGASPGYAIEVAGHWEAW